MCKKFVTLNHIRNAGQWCMFLEINNGTFSIVLVYGVHMLHGLGDIYVVILIFLIFPMLNELRC